MRKRYILAIANIFNDAQLFRENLHTARIIDGQFSVAGVLRYEFNDCGRVKWIGVILLQAIIHRGVIRAVNAGPGRRDLNVDGGAIFFQADIFRNPVAVKRGADFIITEKTSRLIQTVPC